MWSGSDGQKGPSEELSISRSSDIEGAISTSFGDALRSLFFNMTPAAPLSPHMPLILKAAVQGLLLGLGYDLSLAITVSHSPSGLLLLSLVALALGSLLFP